MHIATRKLRFETLAHRRCVEPPNSRGIICRWRTWLDWDRQSIANIKVLGDHLECGLSAPSETHIAFRAVGSC